MTAFIPSQPTLEQWWRAILDTAGVTARHQFPDSQAPMEEATLGPLLERCRIWIQSVGRIETIPVINRLTRVRLAHLQTAKAFADQGLSKQLFSAARRSLDVYRWVKWPLKIYRGFRRASPLALTLEVGWNLVQRGGINYLCRYTYDVAYRELDTLYRDSRGKR
jgi:hypothetical protein